MSERYIKHSLIKENTIERRVYQEVIAAMALRGNTLVILPTGLGKTIIAALVTVSRLTQYPDSKIVVLAPTRPLVEQHRNTFEEILKISPDELLIFTGLLEPKKRIDLWDRCKIAFMTPQTLQNDLTAGRYNLSNVSLIIFDECHRAVGDYAYVYIAKKYLMDAKNPLILGITASPGTTEEEINEIIRNLNIENIEIKDEFSPEVRPYIHKREIQWHHIELPDEFYKILKILNDELKEILSEFKEAGYINSSDPRSIKRVELIELKSKIQNKISKEVSPDITYYSHLVKVANAIRISYLIELLETQGLSAFYNYLQKIEKEASRPGGTRAVKELVNSPFFAEIKALARILIERGIEHPKIQALIDILKEYIAKNPHSRILVFTHFRVSAQLVSETLQKNGFSTKWFIGQQKRGNIQGMSQKAQLDLIKKFSAGEIQILVATSVAEEGLDIAECDLVVFYDNVPSAIRRIQRMGRTGRRRKGQIVVLIAKRTRDEGYYWASVHKEQKMKKLLKEIKAKLAKSQKVKKVDLSQMQLEPFIQKTKEDKEKKVKQIKVIVDHREGSSQLVKELSLMNVKLEFKTLEVADYIVSDRVAIERKEIKDFIDSIKDGRLFKQLKELAQAYPKPILLIEGENLFMAGGISPNAIRGALASIITDFSIPILWSKDPKDSALLIYSIASREQQELKREPVIRSEKAPLLTHEIQEYIIAGIPFVDRKRAITLLTHFKTIQNIFNATEEEIAKLPGFGKKIASKIRKISTVKYEPDTKTKRKTKESN